MLVDTLRVDAMGAFGGSGDAMPFFDELADRSFVFRDAIAASAWTSPSVAALFTSRHQSQHGVTAFTSMLRPEEVTLAEILSERGYATGGFSANWLIRKKAGYGQGFDYFVAQKGVGPAFRSRSERARRTSRRALGWIDGLPKDPSRPLLVYLHLMDPHTPYNPSAETTTWAFGEQPRVSLGQINDAVHDRKSRPMGADMKKAVRKAYQAEVRDVDNEMGAFIAGLEERGLLENSLVVVLADHGEEFWEHGILGHSHSLFDELIHVPMLIHFPGQRERIDVGDTVSLVDLAPTLLDWLGAPSEPRFSGRSLWPALRRHAAPPVERWFRGLHGSDGIDSPAISEHLKAPVMREKFLHERAVVLGRHKLISDLDGRKRFYVRKGLLEEVPEQEVDPLNRARLEDALETFLREVGRPTDAPPRRMSDETRDELKSLGYIE